MASTRPVSKWMILRALAVLALAGPASTARAEDVCALTDVDAFLDRCPTADPVFGKLLADFTITKDGLPVTFPPGACTEPVSAMPIAQYSDELSLLQALRAVYYMDKDRCGHLPWTSLSLYEWLKSKVGGFDINSSVTMDQCCGVRPDGSSFVWLRKNDASNREYHRTWEGAAAWIALLMHEARHRDGFPHVSCCPSGANACDQTYDETNLSPYGIQYWLERAWLSGAIHTGYTCLAPVRTLVIKNSLRGAATDGPTRFCTNAPPLLTDVNNPPPACDQKCAASVTCVARSWGVPPVGGPPNWWSSSPPQPAYHDRLDDPRWSGASKITYGDGTGEKAEVRLLHDGGSVYLSWRALVAPASTPAQNTLYFGYRQAGGGDVIVQVALTALGPLVDSGAFTLSAFLRNPDGSAGAPVALPPDVTSSARVWAEPAAPGSWAVQLKLPVAALQTTCGRFQLWYQLLAGTPTTPVASFPWPRTGVEIDGGTMASPHAPIFPDPALWHWFRPNTGLPGDQCATGGVSLAWDAIGTTNLPSSSEIKYRASAPFPVNTFFARPTNLTSTPIPAGAITATFRLANWGSVPGNWEQGVSAADLWATIPGGGDVPTTGAIPVGATAGTGSEAHFDWTVAGADLAAFLGGTRRSHQCMLVELKSSAAPGLTFLNSSVYRNMDLVTASTFRREAQVSVKGLGSTPAGARDVYAYVETKDMPERVSRAGPGERRTAVETTRAAALPSYKVHVYHDTGKALLLDGVARPVLGYQTSYGYTVTHEGAVDGWRHELGGDALVKLAPDWYRLSIPDGGAAALTTTIEAVEPPGPRWSLSLHFGAAVPTGSSSTRYGSGLGGGVDVETRLTNGWAVEAVLGLDQLPGKDGFADLRVTGFLVSARLYLLPGRLQPFVLAGPSGYDLRPGSLKAGFHAGAGVALELGPRFAVEAAVKLHSVPGATPALFFSTLQAGLRLRL